MKLGWYLPYEPDDNEYGAWKKHYVSCTFSLDTDVPSKYIVSLHADFVIYLFKLELMRFASRNNSDD